MATDDELARWAALFLDSYGDQASTPQPAAGDTQYAGLTPAARDLLRSVDAGGVPAFVTSNLKQIASDNGVEVDDGWTPNEIVDAIRNKARGSASPTADSKSAEGEGT